MYDAISAGLHLTVGKHGDHHVPGVIAAAGAACKASLLSDGLLARFPRLHKAWYYIIAILS